MGQRTRDVIPINAANDRRCLCDPTERILTLAKEGSRGSARGCRLLVGMLRDRGLESRVRDRDIGDAAEHFNKIVATCTP